MDLNKLQSKIILNFRDTELIAVDMLHFLFFFRKVYDYLNVAVRNILCWGY